MSAYLPATFHTSQMIWGDCVWFEFEQATLKQKISSNTTKETKRSKKQFQEEQKKELELWFAQFLQEAVPANDANEQYQFSGT